MRPLIFISCRQLPRVIATVKEERFKQCREKRYADAYAGDLRRVVYVGVNYDPAVRTIGEVKTEAVR